MRKLPTRDHMTVWYLRKTKIILLDHLPLKEGNFYSFWRNFCFEQKQIVVFNICKIIQDTTRPVWQFVINIIGKRAFDLYMSSFDLLTLPEHLISPQVFGGIRVAQSTFLCSFLCSIICLSFSFVAMALSVFFFDLRFWLFFWCLSPLFYGHKSTVIYQQEAL